MTGWFQRKLRAFHDDRKGIAFLYVTICLPVIFAMAVFSLDLGYILYIKSRLQTAADLGALAGAKLLYTNSDPAVAKARAELVVQKNLPPQWSGLNAPVTTVINAIYDCNTTAPFSSTDCGYALSGKNAIRVTAKATAPMYFASFFGTKNMTFQATSVAGGGEVPPLNVVVIVDTTASMNSKCSSDPTKTKLECAKSGVMSLLNGLSPATATVSLMTYPGLNRSDTTNPDKWINFVTCNTHGALTGAGVQSYAGTGNNSPAYSIVSNSTDYKVNNVINTDSLIVKAAGRGTGTVSYDSTTGIYTGCKSTYVTTFNSNGSLKTSSGYQTGLQAVGGVGTYYARALQAARDALKDANTSVTTKRQSVIIILSDGDAQAGTIPSTMASSRTTNGAQCTDAVNVADDATAGVEPIAGKVWVYSIAYDAPSSGCTSKDKIDPCTAMKQVASDDGKFYSNTSSCSAGASNTNADLSVIFKNIAFSLMKTRRVSEAVYPPP